jgi:ribonucleoside-diphosphate reductase alpha chain
MAMKEEILEQSVTGGPVDRARRGLEFKRFYTQEGLPPFEAVEWESRTAAITSESGEVIFEQKNVEVPKSWSMTATNIVASKYFHGKRDWAGGPDDLWLGPPGRLFCVA